MEIHQKDVEIQQKDVEIQQKDVEIQQKNVRKCLIESNVITYVLSIWREPWPPFLPQIKCQFPPLLILHMHNYQHTSPFEYPSLQ